MPLLVALDNETGIGYLQSSSGDIAPLVDDIAVGAIAQDRVISINATRRVLLRKHMDAIASNAEEVTINERDFDINESRQPLSDTISAIVSFLGKDSLGKEQILYKGSAGMSSAANLLGRFTHADEQISEFAMSIAAMEQDLAGDAVLAEIVHIPQGRIGNVLMRKKLREYEIPLLAKSCCDSDHQIPPDDLLIRVHENRIILRSRKLDKEVVPRLATSHNFSMNSLPIYHFLCDLQFQDKMAGLMFDWTSLVLVTHFVPG
ncbi:MAG: lantibiotic dehydratase [Bacteroidota bacterium]